MQAVVAVRCMSVSRFDVYIELVLRDRRAGRRCFHLQIYRVQRVSVVFVLLVCLMHLLLFPARPIARKRAIFMSARHTGGQCQHN